MEAPVVIKVEDLSKRYMLGVLGGKKLTSSIRDAFKGGQSTDVRENTESTYWALRKIDFEVRQGEILGIIGKNGAGKSTLLKVLSQISGPTTGDIKIKGRISTLLQVGTGMHPELTGRENIFLNGAILGMTRKEIKSKIDDIIEFSGVERYIDTPTKRYSSGMTVRLGFAVAAHLEPEILIIDEVLAVGDAEFQKKCLGKMKDAAGAGRTVLFVSHDMNAVQNLCTRCILLKDGLIDTIGDTQDVVDRYLTLNSHLVNNGVIDIDFPREGSLDLKFSKVMVVNDDEVPVDQVFYQQGINVRLEFNTKKSLEGVQFSVNILSATGIHISDSVLPENGEQLNLEQGEGGLNVYLEPFLLPGNYAITVRAMDSNGNTLDHVENVYDFTVMTTARERNQHYVGPKAHAFVQVKAKWNLLKGKGV